MTVLLDSWVDGDGTLHHVASTPGDLIPLWRGRRNRQIFGLESYCPDCHYPVHIYKLANRAALAVRHNPNATDRCQYVNFYQSCKPTMSPRHRATATRIALSISDCAGWDVTAEQRFADELGNVVIPDVYAKHRNPRHDYQRPVAHEVQLSRQPYVDTVARTRQRSVACEARTIWWTPSPETVTPSEVDRYDPTVLGIILDDDATIVADRAYSALFPEPVEMRPTVAEAAKRMANQRDTWVLVEDPVNDGRYSVLMPFSAASTVEPRPPRRARRTPLEDVEATGCDRVAPVIESPPPILTGVTAPHFCSAPALPGTFSGVNCGLTADETGFCWVHRQGGS